MRGRKFDIAGAAPPRVTFQTPLRSWCDGLKGSALERLSIISTARAATFVKEGGERLWAVAMNQGHKTRHVTPDENRFADQTAHAWPPTDLASIDGP